MVYLKRLLVFTKAFFILLYANVKEVPYNWFIFVHDKYCNITALA